MFDLIEAINNLNYAKGVSASIVDPSAKQAIENLCKTIEVLIREITKT